MRIPLCEALVAESVQEDMVFLTGDLGFMALEPLRDAMGARFINAGVAEQNMVTVAAAMAREGLRPWVYSIAPFCYARPFEQIRNDVCFHHLPVKLIGNGGGYGYGVMGPTHHAIEDCGVLLALPNLEVFVPVFDSDVPEVIRAAARSPQASYIRLGRDEAPQDYQRPEFAPVRHLLDGAGPPVLALGPLASLYIAPLRRLPVQIRPALWAVARLPLESIQLPESLLTQAAMHGRLLIAEEHVARGGLASEFALRLARCGLSGIKLHHLYALSHHYATYGSQNYLRALSRLDAPALLAELGISYHEHA